jgi:[protein-PII] uridylyltransferase
VDVGLELGFALRTPRQAHQLSWQDAMVFTSLVESRLLIGSVQLFTSFMRRFRIGARRRHRKLVSAVEAARREERSRYGETVYLLHPNVKRSRGCLRDVQLVRWIGFARYGEADLEQLMKLGLLPELDYRALYKGYQFLLRLRNELHFKNNRAVDSLDRASQVSLAAAEGIQERDGVLPVETFMRGYFEVTSQIRHSATEFVESAKVRSWFVRLFGRVLAIPIGEGYRLGFNHVWATAKGLEKLKSNPVEVITFMKLANRFDRRIEQETWHEIRNAMQARENVPLGPDAAAAFMQLLEYTPRLGEVLRRLHELRVLEQIIPAMSHARCLMQFNDYHKYTVDAHCIRAVEKATEYSRNNDLLGQVYKQLKRKSVLHLALLLHDLGKGFSEDHSEVGKRIAEETADLLRLSETDTQMVSFLVHQHLTMTHTAFRFDLTQLETILMFVSKVGSLAALQHLYVVSCADLDAVGPGALNDWKLNLLNQLYRRSESQFRDDRPDEWFVNEVAAKRAALLERIPTENKDWWGRQINAMTPTYLLGDSPSRLIADLTTIQKLSPDRRVIAWATRIPEPDAIEYSVAVLQSEKPIGIVHRITGVLGSQSIEILSADVHSQPLGIAWDRFLTHDLDHSSAPPQARLDQVCRAIEAAFETEEPPKPKFRKVWKSAVENVSATIKTQPTHVQFDNTSSEEFTIVSIFAYNRLGLLYAISKVLDDQRIVLNVAKISTHLDQVVDVFYISDLDGRKILEPTRLYTLRQRLLAAAEGN